MNDPRGIVFDIQRGAFHDGPGLRTTVFLKGCPLRCAWCHNPESQAREPETGCSGRVYGREMSVTEVMAVARRDARYYASSGGGVTISGGEPTVQYAFCATLLAAAKAEGFHTCLDTCGALDWPRLDALRPHVDLFLFDYKATGAATHRALTGIGPETPHGNLRRLLAAGASVRLRCPLVPGLNADDEHLAAILALGREFPALEVDLLPYHAVGAAKYEDLGRPRPEIPPETVDVAGPLARRWAETLAAEGVGGGTRQAGAWFHPRRDAQKSPGARDLRRG